MYALANVKQVADSWRRFYTSVALAAWSFVPKRKKRKGRKNDGESEEPLHETAKWLNPESVAGFEDADLSILPDDERSRLRDAVERFRAVAATVPRGGPAKQEQVDEGRKRMLEILKIMQPGKFQDPEAFVIGKFVEAELFKTGTRPRWLLDMAFRTGDDWSGDPGIWVSFIISDEDADSDVLTEERFSEYEKMRQRVREAIRKIDTDRLVYFSLRPRREHVSF